MHQVFLSSTARDLTAYRDAVTNAIKRLDGFHCVRMEDFGARDAQADDFCRAKIAECEVAVFIIGLCYGSSPPGADESYTVREYEAAKAAAKPRLVFLSAEGKSYEGFDPFKREPEPIWEKQLAFRGLLNKDLIRDEFTTPDELATKVTAALSNLVRDTPESQPASGMTSSERALRDAYLNRVKERCGYLSLAGIDPAAAQSDGDRQLNLNAVYTALLTHSPRQEEAGELKTRVGWQRKRSCVRRWSSSTATSVWYCKAIRGAARAPSSTSWRCVWPEKRWEMNAPSIRCATRGRDAPGSRNDNLGFRVVVSPLVFSER